MSAIVRSLAVLAVAAALSAADLAPGLVAEYMQGVGEYPSRHPERPAFFVRIDDQLDFSSVEGQFYGTKLSTDFGARWTGVLRVPAAGQWSIATESDDGSTVALDGKPLVDNGGRHAMRRVAATADLTAGDHAIVVEFDQGEGGAGCRLLWTPPGGVETSVPRDALFHEAGAEQKVPWDQAAWKAWKDRGPHARYSDMDHGPFVCGTIGAGGDNWAVKGVAVTLDKGREAIAVFDLDLLRWSIGGVDSYIKWPAGRDGLEGQPQWHGDALFRTRPTPGWASPDGSFADPRATHAGPLPRAWADHRAIYLRGDRVALRYVVGASTVTDAPACVARGDVVLLTRALAIEGGTAALTHAVADRPGATGAIEDGVAVLAQGDDLSIAALVDAPAGAALKIDGDRVLATLPPDAKPFAIALWSGPRAALPSVRAAIATLHADDPRALCAGGGGKRWEPELETKGQLGTGDRAYVVDTLTVPYENPWKAYMRLTGHDFFRDGRAAVCTIDGDVWVVSGIDDGLEHVRWKRFATGLFQPLGLRIVDDVVYVTCRDGIDRLRDLDGDGEADVVESFNHDCQVTVNYHEFHLDLETDADGNFYYNMGYPLNQVSTPHQGCVHEVSKDGATLTMVATGLRAPNGMGGGDGKPLMNSDNQGNWMPVCRVNLIKAGGFYGMLDSAHQEPKPSTYDPPICWIPYSVDNSTGGLAWVTSDRWGPLKDAAIATSYGTSSLFTLFVQDSGGVPQGGVVRFPLSFQSGIMRARFSAADGQLYVTGMRGWQTNAAREGAFHRVRYTGKKHYQPIAAEIIHAGVRLRFAEPVDPEIAGDVANYAVERWNYRWTGDYGSPEVTVADATKEGHDPVTLAGAQVDADGTSITLSIPDLAPVMTLKVKYKLLAADGAEMADDVYLTVNTVP